MRSRAICLGLVLCAFAGRALGDDSVESLIEKLGDREPTVRADATEQLRRMGEAAGPALRVAAQSSKPAIADAATSMLMERRWFLWTDPRSVQQALRVYGTLQPEQRAGTLRILMKNDPEASRSAVLRVLLQDPSDSVAWRVLSDMDADAGWIAALTPIKFDTLPPGLQMFYARGLYLNGEVQQALPLLRQVIDREAERPVASVAQLAWAVPVLVNADILEHQPLHAIQRLRALLARADDTVDPQKLIDMIFAVQIQCGPLQGLPQDLAATTQDKANHASLTLAALAAAVDAPVAHDVLMDVALRDQSGETAVIRADRLNEAGLFLFKANAPAEAERMFLGVTEITADTARAEVTNAYLYLSEVFQVQKKWQEGGDALQRAITSKLPQTSFMKAVNNALEPWPQEDVQAKVYWFYYMLAKANNDAVSMHKQAELALASGSTDGSIFLDVLPTLEASSPADAVDAYFDRVYQRAITEIAHHPNTPVWLNDIAWTCGRSGRHLDEADSYITQALKLRPNEAAYLDTAAEIKFRLGKPNEALALETRAAASMPDEPFMQEQLQRFKKAAATQPVK